MENERLNTYFQESFKDGLTVGRTPDRGTPTDGIAFIPRNPSPGPKENIKSHGGVVQSAKRNKTSQKGQQKAPKRPKQWLATTLSNQPATLPTSHQWSFPRGMWPPAQTNQMGVCHLLQVSNMQMMYTPHVLPAPAMLPPVSTLPVAHMPPAAPFLIATPGGIFPAGPNTYPYALGLHFG